MKKIKILTLLLCFVIGCSLAMTACNKKDKKDTSTTDDLSVTPTITQAPTDIPDNNVTPTPDNSMTTPTPEEEYLTETEAIRKIQEVIGERGYYIELLDDHLNVGDSTYYVFQISDSSQVIEPNVIVERVNGEILCYKSDGTTAPFSEFPLYSEPTPTDLDDSNDEDTFTKEDAYNLLKQLPKETLDLPAEITEYTIEYDDWTTNVRGVSGYIDCFGINVFSISGDNKTLVGQFYVAVDGSALYKYDSFEDTFIEIKDK